MKPVMVPKLGSRAASPIVEEAYSPKIGEPEAPLKRRRVAVIVNHGMGQQVPYETMEGVALAIRRGITNDGDKLPEPFVRIVRLGIEGKDDTETELVRVELQVPGEGEIYDVHIYESYWAPLTEGKVSLKDVISFLWDAGINGILNTDSGTFKRWLFGSVRKFKLHRPWLYVLLITTMLLLASLTFMNGVLTAAAAAHAMGSNGSFPKPDLIAPLTSDFLLADLGAILITLGTVFFPLIKKLTKDSSTPTWIMDLEWVLVGFGALMALFAGVVMPGQLIGWHPESHLWPWLSYLARGLVGDQLRLSAVWGVELLAAYAMRWFLIEYVGDVAAYIAAHTVSKFWELRQQIWQTALKVARAVYRAETEQSQAGEQPDFLYHKIIIVGHSLGSVIGYDVLNGLLLEEGFSKQPLEIAKRTRMFLTFGSPLDKTAFLFKTQKDMNSPVLALGAAAVQPMIQHYANRPLEWVNLWSRSDLISGHLDFYDPPNTENAKHKADSLDSSVNPLQPDRRAVQNKIDSGARTPFAAHVEYWTSNLFAKELVRGITT
ncbi:MAG: hypothetical protein WCA49_18675 [Candidatus Sulfotelmatobacter sp.]